MKNGKSLEGRVAIVTGAAGGIGRCLVKGLSSEGARICALDIDQAGLEHMHAELPRKAAVDVFALPSDIAEPDTCEDAVRQTVARFGAVHILINNAALGMGVIRADHMTELIRLDEITTDVWQRFLDINLSAPFYMTRAVMPHFLAQRFGRVITVTTSFFTMLRGGFAPYGPIKAGLEALSAGHAKEFNGTGVTVNVVVPGGPTDTPMVPQESGLERSSLIPPQAMVPPMVWLCRPEGDGVTGRRFVAAKWDATLPPTDAAVRAGAPIGWPELAQDPVWPGGKPAKD